MMQMLFADGSPLPTLTAAGCETTRRTCEDLRVLEAPGIAAVPLWGPRLARPDAVPSSAPGSERAVWAKAGIEVRIAYGFLPRRCRVTGPLRDGSTEQAVEIAPRRRGPGARFPGSSPDPLPVLRGTGGES